MGIHGRQRKKDELWALSQVCGLCGKRMKYLDATLDHIRPVSKGGSSKLANLQLAHRKCNTKKGNCMDFEIISGAEPLTDEPVPGVGPILDLFVRGAVVFASRSNGVHPVVWFVQEGGWVRHEPGAMRRLMDEILDGATPLEVVTPNVRAKRATTAGRQARATENVHRTWGPGLVACRWRSA